MEWRFKAQVSLQHFTTTMTNYTSFWIFTSFNVVVFLMRMRREKVNEERYIENTLVTKCEPSILKACEICLELLQSIDFLCSHCKSRIYLSFLLIIYHVILNISVIHMKLIKRIIMFFVYFEMRKWRRIAWYTTETNFCDIDWHPSFKKGPYNFFV